MYLRMYNICAYVCMYLCMYIIMCVHVHLLSNTLYMCTSEQVNVADLTMKPTPDSTVEHAGNQWAVYNRTFHGGDNIVWWYIHICISMCTTHVHTLQ